jgi:lysozyme
MMNRFAVIVLWLLGIFAVIHLTNQFTHIEENIMAITKSTLSYITEEEGKRNKAYKDSKGLWTIGVGHLIRPGEEHLIHATLTDAEVEELLRSDLKWCSEAVEGAVKVPLEQHQFDALYSLCFNIGGTAFKNSTVVRKLNAGDYKGAADAILMWNKPAVLEKRRKRERELFLGA